MESPLMTLEFCCKVSTAQLNGKSQELALDSESSPQMSRSVETGLGCNQCLEIECCCKVSVVQQNGESRELALDSESSLQMSRSVETEVGGVQYVDSDTGLINGIETAEILLQSDSSYPYEATADEVCEAAQNLIEVHREVSDDLNQGFREKFSELKFDFDQLFPDGIIGYADTLADMSVEVRNACLGVIMIQDLQLDEVDVDFQ